MVLWLLPPQPLHLVGVPPPFLPPWTGRGVEGGYSHQHLCRWWQVLLLGGGGPPGSEEGEGSVCGASTAEAEAGRGLILTL